ncbi:MULTISPECIES: hypothetical protein [unclassified Variovorax]|uniref:hypothetical protein n=1 Tax=unclassified Variovorax TaxID=663243 RepID=UPI001BD31904|nr:MULTISPECIES: hypothetical protein [unclassified Variovorax]
MNFESSTSRQAVTKPVSWGLHPLEDSTDSQALLGAIRTRYGFVHVVSVEEGTFLEIVLNNWHYTRHVFGGPISARALLALADKFAQETQLEVTQALQEKAQARA